MLDKPIYLETDLSNDDHISCPCCDYGYFGLPMQRNVKQLLTIARGFQQTGTIPGKRVRLWIHSGARCPLYNRRLGSKSTSQHYVAFYDDHVRAIDFHLEYYSPGIGWCNVPVPIAFIIAECIPDFLNGGIGKYFKWNNPGLHCDRRGKTARWTVR